MSGNIEKRGDQVYRIRISRGKDPNTGKRLAPYQETVHCSKRDAERRLRELLQEMEKTGAITKTPVLTLALYLEEWMRTVAAVTVKPRTLQGHRECVERYLAMSLGKLLLAQVTTARIQEHYAYLVQEKKLGPATVRRIHAVLSQALKVAVQQSKLPHNPAQSVTLPRRAAKPPMRVFATAEAQAFIAALQEDRLGVFFELLVVAGLRPGEAAGLLWDCVDFHAGRIRVERSLVWLKGGKWELSTTKTIKSRRAIPLPEELMRRLAEHRDRQALEKQMAIGEGRWAGTVPLVFSTVIGTPLSLTNLRKRHLLPLLKRAGMTPAEFKGLYSIRHSSASLLLAQNVHAKVVSERLGHSSIQLTMDTYSHLTDGLQKGATDSLAGALYGK